jgi:hypothetical protein
MPRRFHMPGALHGLSLDANGDIAGAPGALKTIIKVIRETRL